LGAKNSEDKSSLPSYTNANTTRCSLAGRGFRLVVLETLC
jgi:hypothetical protein